MAILKLSFVFLALLSFVIADGFMPYARYIMTSKYLTDDGKKIKDSIGEGKNLYELSGKPIPAQCEYTKVKGDGFRLIGDLRDFVSFFTTDITISVWYYNDDYNKGGRPFSFLDSLSKLNDGYQIMVEYDKLKASYKDFHEVHNKKHDFSFPTPYGWNLFTFHWNDNLGAVTWSIYTQDFSKRITSENPWYELPNYFSLGYNTFGYFYEIQITKGALASYDKLHHEYSIKLIDGRGNEAAGAINSDIGPCNLKHPEMGCLSVTCCQFPENCDIFEVYGNCKACSDLLPRNQ
ncbi:unnamed protein product [Blepharisma stoltei]|uniref:Uncharacterized protein n=1 Tax=Blepharisma stoltei TaxID=1481888 RepID=A0AAU9J9X5_9CILI|nr:unnamed protein product [Blepharisma stoltei]